MTPDSQIPDERRENLRPNAERSLIMMPNAARERAAKHFVQRLDQQNRGCVGSPAVQLRTRRARRRGPGLSFLEDDRWRSGFFRATALAEELHLIDFHDWDDWESEKVQYRSEAEVSWLVRTGAGERRVVRIAAELDAAIGESASPRGIYLYVSENLIQEAKHGGRKCSGNAHVSPVHPRLCELRERRIY